MKNKNKIFLAVVTLLLLMLIATPHVFAKNEKAKIEKKLIELELIKIELSRIESSKNSIFNNRVIVTDNNKTDLVERTKAYFKNHFPTSPVDPEELVNLAQLHNFPLDFIILNGHLESHMCTKGRGADSNNCHNVNNTDAGDYKPTVCGQYTECLNNVYIGEVKFINLIKNCYMNENQLITLQAWLDQDFRIQRTVAPYCNASKGSRYMTDVKSLSKYQYGIQNWINPTFEGYLKK
jgi:hypothetical protein